MRKKSLTAVGAVGVSAAAVYISRRRRHARPKLYAVPQPATINPITPRRMVRAWLLIVAAMPGSVQFYPPRSWWQDAWTISIGGLASAVLSIVGFITQPIVALVNGVWSFLSNVISNLWTDITNLGQWVYDLGAQLGYELYRLVDTVRDIVMPIINAVLDPIVSLVNQLWGYVDSLSSNLWAYVQGPVEALIDFLLSPLRALVNMIWGELEEFINDPLGYLTRMLGNLIDELIQMALDGLTFAGELCMRIVDTGLSFALGMAGGALEILKGAWHVITWIALHPDDVIEQIARNAIHQLTAGDYGVVKSLVNDNLGHFEDLTADLLGL